MSKQKIGVLFGGMSTEHDVSVVSGTSVIKNLNQGKYEILPIYIDKDGKWFAYTKPLDEIQVPTVGQKVTHIKEISNPIEYIKNLDIVFPVLHGRYGEDGTIQGMLELLSKKYVGCNILSSSICMDKVYAKVIFEKAEIDQANYIYIRKCGKEYIYVDNTFTEEICSVDKIGDIIEEKLQFPVFVKPSNSGSSVGIHKSHNKEELIKHIEYASQFDKKILIEQTILGREVECAVLGNEQVEATCVGEILPAEEFYTFDAKYKMAESKVVLPASLPQEISEKIQNLAIKAFKAVGGTGLARVDFFVENGTNRIIINEINTMPGFTQISMYPKLWEQMGVNYGQLLDKLIELVE